MGRHRAVKANELVDAHISFVSLVDAAANRHKFLMAKAEDGGRVIEHTARIIRKDTESHYVTGIVYEPLAEDTQGEYMTAEEIQKAAYWYMKNAQGADIQHSFVQQEGVYVVESWVEKADTTIEGEDIKAGTWMMTMEITDSDVWDAVAKGEITGFSMGGYATTGKEDVDLSELEKNNAGADEPGTEEKKGFLVKMAQMLGISSVIKGEVADTYNERIKGSNFWAAIDSLESALRKWDSFNEKYVYETDAVKIKEALMEFSAIITNILQIEDDNMVAKAVLGTEKPANKASEEAVVSLKAEIEKAQALVKSLEGNTNTKEKEESDVTKAEIQELVKAEVAKAMTAKADDAEAAATPEAPEATTGAEEAAPEAEAPAAGETPEADGSEITEEAIEKMVAEAVAKATAPAQEQPAEKAAITMEQVSEMIEKAVQKAVGEAVEPIAKHTGVPSNMNGAVEKNDRTEQHYLAGIL